MRPDVSNDALHTPEWLLSCRSFVAEKHPQCCAALIWPKPLTHAINGLKHIQILLMYPSIKAPWEEIAEWDGCTLETFVHDERTLEIVLREQEFPSGVPVFSRLIIAATCIANEPSLDARLKCMAQKSLDAGPPTFSEAERRVLCAQIACILGDLAAAPHRLESFSAFRELNNKLGTLWLRGQGRWSASGPEIQRIISLLEPEFGKKWESAFAAGMQGSLEELQTLAQHVFQTHAAPLLNLCRAQRSPDTQNSGQFPSPMHGDANADGCPQLPKPLFELTDAERTLQHSQLGTVQLRSATLSDVTELRNLLHDAYKMRARQGLNFTASYQDEEMTRDSLLKDDRQTFLAAANGTLAGTFQLCMNKRTALGTGVSFNRFGIHPDYRGHGLGGILLEHAAQISRSRGCEHLFLDTAQPAFDLVTFYQRHGFAIVGQTWWDGKTYASWIMRRKLR